MAQSVAILTALQHIQSLTKDVHWFCPRKGFNDDGYYYPEDIEANIQTQGNDASEDITKEVDAAITRKTLTFEALQIFAFDGKDAAQYQDWLEAHLGDQLRRCDVCVREYHRGRKVFKEKLNDIYDEDEVRAFLERFDKLNLERIQAGLTLAAEQLESVQPEQRRATMLSPAALYAIFESFTCPPMYRNEELLQKYFDRPFELVQTNRFLKLSAYTPAITQFLFGRSPERAWWAGKSWQKLKRTILASEFEWSVRGPLLDAMARVQMYALEKDFLPQFWDGVRNIVESLDRELITHSLRAIDNGTLETDVCRLALNHLQVDTDGLKSLLATVFHILKVSPTDFWEAMGTISPTSWIDQFFSSPALERLLLNTGEETTNNSPILDALFGWVIPFLSSIKSVNQAPAARGLLHRLLGSFQTNAWPPRVRSYCFGLGLHVLAETFRSLNYDKSLNSSGVASAEAFEIAEQYIVGIAPFAKKTSIMVTPASEVFRQIVALDCRYLTLNYELLSSDQPIQQSHIVYHPSIWKHAVRSIDSGNTILAKRLLLATRYLIGLEKFVTKSTKIMPPARVQFNGIFEALCHSLCEMIERLNDFHSSEMEEFFDEADSTNSIIVLLFASDLRIRDAAVEFIKTMSGQPDRRDAMYFLLNNHLYDIMNALSLSFRQITHRKSFAPASNMLKLCTDIVDVLFDSQDGLVRSEALTKRDAQAIEKFWEALWQTLAMIFSTTEKWSDNGHDKALLMDFCRNAMEFADKLFEQFGVLTGALNQPTASATGALESSGKRLIEQPRVATNAIVKWLKLRDDFLVAKSCALVCKLLVRLKEFNTELDADSQAFVMQVAYSQARTTLTNQQKAELLRALEQHLGRPAEGPDNTEKPSIHNEKNQKKEIIDLEKWQANAKGSGSERDDWAAAISAASPAFERLKAQQAAKKTQAKLTPKQSVAAVFKPVDSSDFRKKRQQEMEEMNKKRLVAIAASKKRIAGEGSGLQGLGMQGKDHTAETKGNDMMVSSDEDSSDDDDDSNTDLDRELFGGSSKSLKKVVGKSLTDEQAKALKQQRQGPVKKQRLVRSARDMRARLAPDLSPLHKNLLAWEYFHDGNFPPNTSAQDYTGVVNSFRDPVAYQRTFQPLLILEAWNGFLKAREENTARPYEIKIVNRSSVDAFLEISSTMSRVDAKEVSEGDIILLSKAKSPGSSQSEPHALSRIFRITHKKGVVEISYRVMPGTGLTSSLVPNAILYGLKIMSVVPLEREYGALLGLPYYDLCDEITRAIPSPLLTYNDATLQSFIKTYTVNKAQAKAIKCAIDNDGFTLVQGPPGSGKTKTIVAIVGALLSDTLSGTNIQAQSIRSGGLAKKMLVCAPSNAAVDELVMRFKEGIKTLSNQHRNVNIVRLGRSDAINANVVDVTLEELVNKKLNIAPADGNGRAETQKVMEEHKVISEKLRNVRTKMDEAENKGGPSKELKEEFDTLRRQKTALGQKVDAAKDNENVQSREAEINKKRAQQQIIDEAHIICATLSGSGHDMFQSLNVEFETVIIDEAAQCVELSCLIPLKYGCAKCILVGDPQQLPPTVFSKDAARFKYEQSLFVRMQANRPQDVHLLDTQYRMHPDISLFPSKTFYDGRLLDGPRMAPLRSRPWHATDLLSPFRFFDVQGQHQSAPTGHSLINQAEIDIAMKLYRRLTTDFKEYKFKGKIGIITPYKSQLRELKDQFRRKLGQDISEGIEFNTTDAFQGREAEIIIFSCVRASPSGGIGFLQDIRRMNVGLTRAKCSLWVLGNSQSLMKGEFWAKLVQDAMARNCYTTGDLQLVFEKPLPKVRRVEDSTTEMTSQSEPMEIDTADKNGHLKHEYDVKKEPAVKREGVNPMSSTKMVKTELQYKPTDTAQFKKEADNKPSTSLSKSSNTNALERPTKRKLSIDSTIVRKPIIKRPQSAVAGISGDDSDVEMKDATPSDPPSAIELTHSSKLTSASPSSTMTPKTDMVNKSGTTTSNGSNTNVANTGKKPIGMAPPPIRKKKPVDPFIRKKPRP